MMVTDTIRALLDQLPGQTPNGMLEEPIYESCRSPSLETAIGCCLPGRRPSQLAHALHSFCLNLAIKCFCQTADMTSSSDKQVVRLWPGFDLHWVGKKIRPSTTSTRRRDEYIAGVGMIQVNELRRMQGLPPFEFATIM